VSAAVENREAYPLLDVSDLSISYTSSGADVAAVRELSFTLNPAETLAIVGESGSGKTQTALAVMGLLPDNARVSGAINFGGTDLLRLPLSDLNNIRGKDIAMVFQDPMTSLNPHVQIGDQMSLVLRRHLGLSKTDALARCTEMLDAVRIPEAGKRITQYPHELSGGMRQRVMIASALLCKPKLLIADEPTTALDVSVQARILSLMQELQSDLGVSTLFITHDMGVVAGIADRVLVMQTGRCVEQADVTSVFTTPANDYTRALLKAVPRLDAPGADLAPVTDSAEALRVAALEVDFSVPSEGLLAPAKQLKALRSIGFSVRAGETLGVVGESGCGKSTMAKAVLQLLPSSAGSVALLGEELNGIDKKKLQSHRKDMQVIFQDPLASLNPRMTIADILREPLDTYQSTMPAHEKLQRAAEVLGKVGLKEEHLHRYPHEFSGGQCQRIGIGRALMFEPRLIICDEPVSALDVSVQARIVELLIELQKETGVALVFIAHDLAVVRQISHRVMVMYLGKVIEIADRDAIYENPQHPYTKALMSAVPIPDPDVQRNRSEATLSGDLPSPLSPPSGCAFRSRCPAAKPLCAEEEPKLQKMKTGEAACHFPLGEQAL